MVLQPHLARAAAAVGCLVALVGACGKQAPAGTPPDPDFGAGEVKPPSEELSPEVAALARAEAAAAEPPAGDVEELYVDGVRLRLATTECRLTATFLEEELVHRFEGFPGACHFAPDGEGRPWVVGTDHGKAVLVQSSVPADAESCDTALQIVVVTEKGPALSRQIQRVAGCGPGPWDEMMYHVLASDRVALGGG